MRIYPVSKFYADSVFVIDEHIPVYLDAEFNSSDRFRKASSKHVGPMFNINYSIQAITHH